MPWSAADARRFTKAAGSAKQKRQWSHTANSVLARTGSERKAIMAANAAVKRRGKSRT